MRWLKLLSLKPGSWSTLSNYLGVMLTTSPSVRIVYYSECVGAYLNSVRACANNGVHYIDLAGESHFAKTIIIQESESIQFFYLLPYQRLTLRKKIQLPSLQGWCNPDSLLWLWMHSCGCYCFSANKAAKYAFGPSAFIKDLVSSREECLAGRCPQQSIITTAGDDFCQLGGRVSDCGNAKPGWMIHKHQCWCILDSVLLINSHWVPKNRDLVGTWGRRLGGWMRSCRRRQHSINWLVNFVSSISHW